MQEIMIDVVDGTFQVQGFPDAVKCIKIAGKKAKRLADMAAHRTDLKFVLDCLNERRTAPTPIIGSALERSAILFFCKCFTKGSMRFNNLEFKKVYQGNELAKEAFLFFDMLRNKHLAHDENSLLTVLTGALVNGGGKEHKVEQVVTLSVLAITLGDEHHQTLLNLTQVALSWVNKTYDELAQQITEELNQEDLQCLLARESVVYHTPSEKDFGEKKQV